MARVHDGVAATGAARRAGGRPREFDPAPVIRAGRELLEAGGLEALTIRALSTASGVTVTSIYRNLGDREGVLSAIADAYAEEISLPELPEDPREQMVTIFAHAYDQLVPQTWAIPLLGQSRQFGSATMWFSEYFFRAADALGVDESASVEACQQFWAFTIGALQTRTRDDSPVHRSPAAAEKIAAAAEERGFPRTLRFLEHSNGLTRDAFIAGLRRMASSLGDDQRPA
ncbi:TetR/AcrR family transcriptional regulator [Microbacterium sp.]|uniref:TetR/AcrR family transcriptional regulator n=2 Tax=Microbacterium TaxID=33882 RepID=UPI003F976434